MNKFIIAYIALAALFAYALASPYGGYGGGSSHLGGYSHLRPIALRPYSVVSAPVRPQILKAAYQKPVAEAAAASQSVDLQPGAYSILAVPSYKVLSYDPIEPVRTALSYGGRGGYGGY